MFVCFCTTHCQLLHFLPICRPVPTCDDLHHGGVISRLYDVVAGVSEGAVICLGCRERDTDTALREATVEAEEAWGPISPFEWDQSAST